MALHIPRGPGFSSMLKDGAKYFAGVEEAVLRNIQACKAFAESLRSAFGPRGMNKMVINHLSKLIVTNDAATIIKELEVEHPAAKMIVLAAQMQEQEVGDGTNYVVVFSGALLEAAEDLIRMGLTPVEIVEGYELALTQVLDILPELKVGEIKDCRNVDEVTKGIRTAIMSKQYGNEDFLAKLISQACISVLPGKTAFNVDNIRVCKILGCGVNSSQVIQGMVFKREVEGTIQKQENAKVVVYTCPFDITATETKGTVLIKSAQELVDFSRGEESMLESQVKSIADSGAKVVVAGGKFGSMALHYMNKYGLMGVRVMSKFDLRRVCRAVRATALTKMVPPTSEELGHCDLVYVDEVGDTPVIVFKQEGTESKVSTIVVRGATDNVMDDIERAVDDGVNTYKALTKDGRLLAGAGASEIELSRKLVKFGETCPGLEQYAVKKYAEALEIFPRTLAETAGQKGNELVSKLLAEHQQGNVNSGFDIEGEKCATKDVVADEIYDLYLTKLWALKYATNAVCTILRVDQIIMAKPAGGPKVKPPGAGDPDDD